MYPLHRNYTTTLLCKTITMKITIFIIVLVWPNSNNSDSPLLNTDPTANKMQPCTCSRSSVYFRTYSAQAKYTHPFYGPFSGTSQVSQYRKVKPIWILLKQETVSGSGISWAVCKSAPRSGQTTTPAPHHSVFTGRMPFLPPNQQHQSTEGRTVHLEKTLTKHQWQLFIFIIPHCNNTTMKYFNYRSN